MNNPPFITAKRRVHRKRHSTETAAPSGPLLALSVVSQVFNPDDATIVLRFNTTAEFPLSDGTLSDPNKWSARFEGSIYEGSWLETTAFNELQISFVFIGYEVGANEVGYSNAPSDIADACGRELAAFVMGL